MPATPLRSVSVCLPSVLGQVLAWAPHPLADRRRCAPGRRYEEGFEPYVIISRKFVPWYDERFVGYRKNKVVHLLFLSTSGIQFMVHPRAFTVHSPHPRARTWKVTHKTGLWDQVGAPFCMLAAPTTCLPADAPPSLAGSRGWLGGPALPARSSCSLPAPALQLAEIYEQARSGMMEGSYIPVAMYSCGEHTAGPQLARRPTFTAGTA